MKYRQNGEEKKWTRIACTLCGKVINGLPSYQGGQKDRPVHRGCLVVIKPTNKYGGGV